MVIIIWFSENLVTTNKYFFCVHILSTFFIIILVPCSDHIMSINRSQFVWLVAAHDNSQMYWPNYFSNIFSKRCSGSKTTIMYKLKEAIGDLTYQWMKFISIQALSVHLFVQLMSNTALENTNKLTSNICIYLRLSSTMCHIFYCL